MSRISYEQAEKMSSNKVYFSLKSNGDSAFVQFLTPTMADVPVYQVHEVKDGTGRTKLVDCLKNPGDSEDTCPLCRSGMSTKIVRFAVLYDHTDGCVKFFRRGNSFFNKLVAIMDRYNPIGNHVFEIVRRGAAGDIHTDYDIFPVTDPKIKPIDVNSVTIPSLENTVVKVLDVNAMENYLRTGSLDAGNDTSREDSYQPRPQRRIPVGGNNRGADNY